MAGPRSIGLVVTEHIAAGVVVDNHLSGSISRLAHDEDGGDLLRGMPAEVIVRMLAAEAAALAGGQPVEAIGIAFPGIVRDGIIEDSPNLHQLKGLNVAAAMSEALAAQGLQTPLRISNDADAVATGLAATQEVLDKVIRVWTLGAGIGFGHYPAAGGVWEGILGHRAMRLRFLDREPEEVFAAAKTGPNSDPDPRCVEFALLWHRALAAATATSIHLEGPGKFYITGMNARFVNLGFLNLCVQEMVKLSPLQGYVFEVVPANDELGVIGAAVNAAQA